ncbi:right-handed parallel beta-helix repeat-containing protein [Halomontanus rarus]|uniref:right-handed parallel beta-helix repeat-containing protein n=1 Tax=Halomontanus rarus TaxID=3034020 RepID=UPI0023E7E726|nr:right-handed parallel beta-helix repeat-containing protein [Halovivax sp. TS33]
MTGDESRGQIRPGRSRYPVTEYGADGDGEADDTDAIQAAIDDAVNAGGGVVVVPGGNYRLTSRLELIDARNVVLEGAGTATVLYRDGSDGTVLSIDSSRNAAGQSGSAPGQRRSAHTLIRNLCIDRADEPTAESTGIHVVDAIHTTLQGLAVYNQGRGVVIGTEDSDGNVPEHTTIADSTFEDGYTSQFGPNGYPDAVVKLHDSVHTALHNTFISPTNVGIDALGNSRHVSITQCILLHYDPDGAYNVRMTGTGYDRRIVNSVLENAPQGQIRLEGETSNVTFAGSWIGAGELPIDAPARGIEISDGVSDVSIVDNRIGHQRREGLWIRGSNVTVANNVMVDNVFQPGIADGTTDSVFIEDATHVTFVNNKVWSNWERHGVHITGETDAFSVTGNDLTEFWIDEAGGLVVDAEGRERTVEYNITPELTGIQ